MPVGRMLARAVTGVVGTGLGLRLAGEARRPVGPLQVGAQLELGTGGGARVELAPLGTARLASHRGPLRLRLRPTGVDPGAWSGDLDAGLRAARSDAVALGRALAVRSVAAALGGAAAAAAVTLRRPRDVGGAVAAAGALLAGGAAVAAATRDPDAWRAPELTGLLVEAPRVLGDLRAAPQRLATYRDQLAELIRTGTDVYRAVATLPEPPPAGAIRLLHVSDIHLSPLAYPLARALVSGYGVDAVIDTGDLVDWGTPAEQAVADQIAGLGVPYLFVKGNHDSAGIAGAVGRQPNATVLDAAAGVVEVAGLRFAGMADPRFTPDKTTGDDHAEQRVSEAAAPFAAGLAGRDVDIALVHDPAAGRALAGVVPLVLAGHTHQRLARRYDDTLVLVQGTSGGAGLRGVQQRPTTPVSFSVLYLDRATRRLAAVDEITLGGVGHVSLDVVRRGADELVPS